MAEMERVIPRIANTSAKLLTLKELSRSKEAVITRSSECFRIWIERGVKMQTVIVHLPHIRIGNVYYSKVPWLSDFLAVLQDISHANTARLAEQLGPPVVALKGDVFKGMGS